MAEVAYLDSSALLKLAFPEPETSALEAFLHECDEHVSSRLAMIECGRALRRETVRQVRLTLDQLLESVFLMEISGDTVSRAMDVSPTSLRSLDAIHVATALETPTANVVFVTYDRRLAAAAEANHLTVAAPGR